MQIYNYHAETGEFTNASDALPSPLEPGKFLIPAGATDVAPPKAKAKHAIVWQGEAWGYVKDHRGEVRYSTADGREITIDKLGAIAEVAPGTTDIPQPEAPEGQKVIWTGTAWGFEALPPPSSITMRQARLVLLGAGLLEAVNQAILGMDGDMGVAARIEWEYATSIDRDNPLFAQLAGALNLEPEQIDDLFRAASRL